MTSLDNRAALHALAALSLVLLLPSAAQAAEIKIIASSMSRTFIEGVAESFAQATGHKLKPVFVPSGQVISRVRDGEPADVALSAGGGIEGLAREGKLIAGSTVSITHAATGVAEIGR